MGPENDSGGSSNFRRGSVSRSKARRESMMSLVTDRRESLMSLMSLADCSLVENPSYVEDAQQKGREDNTAKVKDETPPPAITESERTNIVDNTAKANSSNHDSFSNVNNNSNNDSFSNGNNDSNHNSFSDGNNNSNHDSVSNANINASTTTNSSNHDNFSDANNNQSTSSDAEGKGKGGIEYIEEIGSYDIICGRNNGAHNWVGNRRFRITIMMHLKKYSEAPNRDEKTNVIKSVIELLMDTDRVGARFIKKVGEGMYVRLNEKQIREKVGHAFRDMISLAEQEGGKLEAKCFQ